MSNTHQDHQHYIVKGVIEGDPTILREIYQTFGKQILAWVKNNNGTAEDASDLFQDGMEAMMHLSFKPNFKLTCPFGALLYKICRNKWYDRLKLNQKQEAIKIVELDKYNTLSPANDLLVDKAMLEQKCQQLMEQNYARLTTICQQLLNLLKQNIAPEKIAAKLNMTSANTVYRRKFACMKAWRNYVRENAHFEDCKSVI